MHVVTIDTNCVIDLAQGTERGKIIHELIKRNNDQQIVLRVPGISASERQPGGIYLPTFDLFEQKLKQIGLGDVEILRPIAYLGVCYSAWCILPSEEMNVLEHRIHSILFPQIPFEIKSPPELKDALQMPAELNVKWRNAKCDTLGMWCHIYYKGDIFVSADKNFHKATKRSRLIDCGASAIVKPEEILQYLN